jgi:adenylate cyclase class IV
MLRTFEYQGETEVRETVEFDIDRNQEGAENLLRVLQLLQAVIGTIVEKTSESYEVRIGKEKIFLRIDKLRGIPTKVFLEIGAYCEKEDLQKFIKALSSCRKELGLSDKMLITEPYCRLLAKKRRK